MKTQKLPSGSFRIQKSIEGVRHSVTFDHEPTKKEIDKAVAKLLLFSLQEKKEKTTFLSAAKSYTSSKENVLSPSTIRDYSKIPDRLPDWFIELNIHDITQSHINQLVNELALNRSPKTVRNYHGFVSAVLNTYRPDFTIKTHLPQKIKKEPYIPTDNDISKIINYATGTQFEIAIKLGCYGLRRSEICALTPQDLNGTHLTIDKAMVQDKNQNWVIKTTKTVSSTRRITIDKKLAAQIRKSNCVYNGDPHSISKWMGNAEKALGLQHFTLHKCRHYFASKLTAEGIDPETIKSLGGWESDHIMHTVYTHRMHDKAKERRASDIIASSLFS